MADSDLRLRPDVRPSMPDRWLDSPRLAALALVGVIVIFTVLVAIISFKTPAYEASDETGHVQNIETLVSGHWYGMNSACHNSGKSLVDCSGVEAHQAPLYYLLLAGWQRLAGQPVQAPSAGPASFGHTETGVFIHHPDANLRFLLWLRLPNILIGIGTILFTYFGVRIVATDEWTPVVAASIVAFLPRLLFISAFVTNDNLADLLGAALLWTALRYRENSTRWRVLVVGLVLGLLIATKLSAFPLVLVLLVLPLLASGWGTRFQHWAIGVGGTLLASGWYLIQNTVRYGDPLARHASAHYLQQIGGLGLLSNAPYRVSDPLSLVFVQVPKRIFQGFWYTSGWNQFYWHWPANLLFWLALAAALVGLVGGHIAGKTLVVLGVLTVAGLLSVWITAFQTATYEARLAFVAAPAIAALAALGLQRWRPPIRFALPLLGLCGVLVAIQQNVLSVNWSH